jgi:hypothetical protein
MSVLATPTPYAIISGPLRPTNCSIEQLTRLGFFPASAGKPLYTHAKGLSGYGNVHPDEIRAFHCEAIERARIARRRALQSCIQKVKFLKDPILEIGTGHASASSVIECFFMQRLHTQYVPGHPTTKDERRVHNLSRLFDARTVFANASARCGSLRILSRRSYSCLIRRNPFSKIVRVISSVGSLPTTSTRLDSLTRGRPISARSNASLPALRASDIVISPSQGRALTLPRSSGTELLWKASEQSSPPPDRRGLKISTGSHLRKPEYLPTGEYRPYATDKSARRSRAQPGPTPSSGNDPDLYDADIDRSMHAGGLITMRPRARLTDRPRV